jgi:hypothetical protein
VWRVERKLTNADLGRMAGVTSCAMPIFIGTYRGKHLLLRLLFYRSVQHNNNLNAFAEYTDCQY